MTKFVSDSLTAFRKKCSPLLSTSILFFASISIVLAVPITNDTIKDAGNLVEKIEKKAESSQRKLKELKKSLDSLKEDILDLALKNKKLKKGMSMAPVKKTGFFSFKKTKAELTKEIEQGIEEIRDLVAKQITIEKEINREKNMLAEEQTQFTHVKFKLAKLKEDLAKQNKKIADAAKLKKEEEKRIALEKKEKAKELAEPGFWRRRALKKGEKPQTQGEKNCLTKWEKEKDIKLAEAKATKLRKKEERVALEKKKIAKKLAKERNRTIAKEKKELKKKTQEKVDNAENKYENILDKADDLKDEIKDLQKDAKKRTTTIIELKKALAKAPIRKTGIFSFLTKTKKELLLEINIEEKELLQIENKLATTKLVYENANKAAVKAKNK